MFLTLRVGLYAGSKNRSVLFSEKDFFLIYSETYLQQIKPRSSGPCVMLLTTFTLRGPFIWATKACVAPFAGWHYNKSKCGLTLGTEPNCHSPHPRHVTKKQQVKTFPGSQTALSPMAISLLVLLTRYISHFVLTHFFKLWWNIHVSF